MSLRSAAAMYGQVRGGPYTADMAKRKIIGAQEARQTFAALIADAAEGVQTIVFRRSTPVVVVVPAEWFHRAAELMGEPWEDWTPPAPKPPAKD
jgi:prevent-host-death family protein